MSEQSKPTLTIRTTASAYRCQDCPPDRVCAWGCIQGAGVEEIIITASLALEDDRWSLKMPQPPEQSQDNAEPDSFMGYTM